MNAIERFARFSRTKLVGITFDAVLVWIAYSRTHFLPFRIAALALCLWIFLGIAACLATSVFARPVTSNAT